jgi:N-acetylmuramoyl-L-alanine amidase
LRRSLLAALGLLALAASGAPAAATLRVAITDGLVAALEPAGLFLEAQPLPGEGILAFARRLCGDEDARERILGPTDSGRRLLAGVRYRVPFDCLRSEHRDAALRALFPDDRASSDGWLHRVGSGLEQRDLWQIAEWFTGSGENYRVLREHNQLRDESLLPGTALVIPTAVLRSPFSVLTQRALPQAVGADELRYGRDSQGEFAAYRLRGGEALYSSVVVRYTGRLLAVDVNALAEEIAQRSGIADVTDIPIGYEVKIPLDALSPEYLPRGDRRRIEYEQNLAESSRYTNQVTASGLSGVVVVLDAGHGGADVGATMGGVWESLYVYDIMLRVRRILERSTAATVLTTTRDGGAYRMVERDVLPPSRGHTVLTDPPYPIQVAEIGTNLRWYLSNSIFDRHRSTGVDPEKVVFVSIHADSLHPSVRGAMVYVPGLLNVGESYSKSGTVYASRKEVRDRPSVAFTRKERVQSEGLSRDLAGHLLAGFRSRKLAVHPNQPIRDRIIRGRGRAWVPAVLRYNAVPARILLEVCNLANDEDRRLITTQAYREQVAAAVVDGLLAYYGYQPGSTQLAAAGQ